jgi:hypothetical protein
MKRPSAKSKKNPIKVANVMPQSKVMAKRGNRPSPKVKSN